jgi:hypothetical protein
METKTERLYSLHEIIRRCNDAGGVAVRSPIDSILAKSRTGTASKDTLGRMCYREPTLIEGRHWVMLTGEMMIAMSNGRSYSIDNTHPIVAYTEEGVQAAVQILTNKRKGGRKRGKDYAQARSGDWISYERE